MASTLCSARPAETVRRRASNSLSATRQPLRQDGAPFRKFVGFAQIAAALRFVGKPEEGIDGVHQILLRLGEVTAAQWFESLANFIFLRIGVGPKTIQLLCRDDFLNGSPGLGLGGGRCGRGRSGRRSGSGRRCIRRPGTRGSVFLLRRTWRRRGRFSGGFGALLGLSREDWTWLGAFVFPPCCSYHPLSTSHTATNRRITHPAVRLQACRAKHANMRAA